MLSNPDLQVNGHRSIRRFHLGDTRLTRTQLLRQRGLRNSAPFPQLPDASGARMVWRGPVYSLRRISITSRRAMGRVATQMPAAAVQAMSRTVAAQVAALPDFAPSTRFSR